MKWKGARKYITLHNKHVRLYRKTSLITLYTKIIFNSKEARALAIRQNDSSFDIYDEYLKKGILV